MIKKLVSASVVLFLCLSMMGIVSAQNSIGVYEGDSFSYSVTSNSKIPQIYQIIQSPKDAHAIKIAVLKVTSPNLLQINITEQFKNGTQTSWVEDKDLTVASNFPMTFANLNVGDKLWGSESLSPKVNDTATESFSSGSRQINHASIGPSESGYDLVDYSFDKQTGMPTEIRYVESDEVSTTLTLTDSSVWAIPEFPTSVVLFSLMSFASIVVAVAVYKRKECLAKNR